MIVLPFPPSVAGVYRITDSETGRFYIGSSVNIAKRWRQHRERLGDGSHPNPILQAVWNSNCDRLSIEVAEICAPSRAELLASEQRYLDLACVGANRMCMNVLPTAGSHLGRIRSRETRIALSNAMKGKTHSAESRAKMSKAKIGRPLTVAHRKKIGEALRGRRINRPLGIINQRLRALDEQAIAKLRKMRAEGASWSAIAVEFQGSKSSLRRAALGITYRDMPA